MKKNCERVYNAWMNRNSAGRTGDSIWTDGRDIYSYKTAILAEPTDGSLILNDTRYSQTTTTHQNAIRAALQLDGDGYGLAAVVDDVPRGTNGDDLEEWVPR